MRRRRSWILPIFFLPIVFARYDPGPAGYEANPIGRFSPDVPERPYLPPRAPIARGYQPPPQPALFEPPRSYYTVQHHQKGHGHMPAVANPLPKNIGPPASSPSRVKTPRQHQVQPASIPSLEENPPDIENNIIVHIYLNSKGHPPAHAVSKIGPIHGVFGIGTAHGGPGTHQNPIVIVKEFDRDKLKFVDENTANKMMEEGPANIVEVKAMVSTPDKKIETTLNKAVNTELDRAIPVVLNRFHGSTSDMAGDLSLRKELEQALVDEIAKNLGETIDTMSEVTEEDIDKLIEQELETELEEKPTTVAPATKRITIATMTTMAETKTTTQRLVTTRILPSETTRKTTKTTQIPTTARRETITLPRTTQGTRLIQKITTEATPTPSITAKRPSSPSITTRRTTTTTQTTKASPTTRSTESTTGTTHTVTKKISTSSRPPLPSITTVPWLPPTFRVTTEPRTTKERIITITKVPTTITERPTTTTKKYTERARETVTLRPTATTVRSQPTEVPPAKIPINFNEENIIETRPGVQIATAIPTSPSTVIPIHSWTYSSSQPDDDFNIVTSRPIKIVDISSESKEVTGFFAPEATVNVPIDIETATVALTSEAMPTETEEITQGECSIPNDPSERAKADVLFLLDSSNKFTEDKFMHAITLILNTVEKLRNIGSDGVQVSLVQFNTEPYLEFSLRKHNCKQFLKDDIADTQYMTGGSMLGRALEKVMKFAFTKKRGDRPDVPNILIILTDGQSEDRVQLPIQLTRRDHNVTVYVIGTLEANPEYLKSLSGSSDNVFQLSSSENVPLASQLAERIKNERIEIRDDENDEKEEVETGQRQPVVNLNDDGDDSIPPFPPTKTGIVHLECSGEGFKIQFNLPSRFEGHVVVKGREKDSKCQMPIISSHQPGNKTFSFFIPADECGVTTVESQDPQGRNTSVIVHLVHAPSLRTEEDRAFLLQCFIGSKLHEEEVSTQLNVIRSDVTIAETISLSSLPPSCTYSIRKDRPDGAIISRATVGQAVYHRWDCDGDEKASNVYGIKIHSCFASDDVEQKYPIIDSQGCSSDLALLTNPVYDEEKMSAYALSHVFGVLDHDSLKFICKLSLCTRDGDGCEGITPPRCNDNHTDLLVWKPAISQTDSALTSALSTKVDIGVEPLYTRVIGAVLDSKIFLAISGLMLFAAATLLVVHKLRQQQDAVLTSSSSSSYRSRASSHFETSSSEESQTSGQPVDPRLHEFLKTFDRSRYV